MVRKLCTTLAPILIMGTFLLLAGCQNNVTSPDTTPEAVGTPIPATPLPAVDTITIPEPAADSGIITGRIVSITDSHPLTQTAVMLAQITRDGDRGMYVLNTAASPSTLSDNNGNFVHVNIPPGEYVMVVGDPFFLHEVIKDPETLTALPYTVEAGRVTNVGEIKIDLKPTLPEAAATPTE